MAASEKKLHDDALTNAILTAIDRRRVTRFFKDEPVSLATLQLMMNAARRAPSGSNRRIHKFIVVRDPATIRLIKAFSPGMSGTPPAIVVICTDHATAEDFSVQLDADTTTWIDVGTATMNLIVAADALGLGSCPVTSFSRGGVSAALDLPETVTPELMLILGYPMPDRRSRIRPKRGRSLDDLVHWERLGHTTPDG
jgi:nitroreductase